MNSDWPIAHSMPEYTLKDAHAADFGQTYDDGSETRWPKRYKDFASHRDFNAFLRDGSTLVGEMRGGIQYHAASVQPYQYPKPGAKPSEDRFRFELLDSPKWEGEWIFGAVFDGHAGEEVADDLNEFLCPQLLYSLELLYSRNPEPEPREISDLLIRLFETFDKSMIDELFKLLPSDYDSLSKDELKKVVNDQASGGRVYNACIRCMRGSTGIVSLIDPKRSNIWVANLGDCQAMLTEYFADDPDEFKTTLLSSPHNPRTSEKELERVKLEHPDELGAVVNYRILGALAVSRAFGDFAFKLPSSVTEKVFLSAEPGFRMHSKVSDFLPRNLTPPYVSSSPEVFHRALKPSSDPSSPNSVYKHHLVLCSDGLTDLYDMRRFTREGAARQMGRVVAKPEGDRWANLQGILALHLIKDALGDNLGEQCKRYTVDLDFQHMDDTTVVVLSW